MPFPYFGNDTGYKPYRYNNVVETPVTRRIALKSLARPNDPYVCAESGGGQLLMVNRPAIGAWETMDVFAVDGNKIVLRVDNGQYVCAEGASGKLIADRNSWDRWETFEIVPRGGNRVALKALDGGYVCAEGGGGTYLIANRSSIGPGRNSSRSRSLCEVAPVKQSYGSSSTGRRRITTTVYAP